ncbi:MAG: MFS transporter [Ilumatobacteraceae bacterium]
MTPSPMTSSQKLLAIGLVLGVTLVAFEVTAVVTAMPTITDELGGDSLYGLAMAVYTLANMVALVAAGEMADKRGPALPYVLSISLFIGGLVVAAAAPTMVLVVIGRTLQGAGTGGLQPIAYTLVNRAFPTERQPKIFAILSAGWVLPSLFAPAISGWVVDSFGWRWVFLGIIPVAIVVAGLAVQPMRKFGPIGRGEPRSRIPQAMVAAAGVGVMATGLQLANPIGAVALTVVGAVAAWRALKVLLPDGVAVAQAGLAAIVAARILATATFMGVDSFVPLAADRIHGARPLVQGFVIIGAAVSWTLGQWWRAKRPPVDPARAVRNGFLILGLGVALVTPVLWSGWPLWATFLAWCVGGYGMGLLFNPTTVTAMQFATAGSEGKVSSQVTLGDALGFSLMGGVGGATVAVADRTSMSISTALGINFAMAFGLAIVGVVAASRIRAPRQAG